MKLSIHVPQIICFFSGQRDEKRQCRCMGASAAQTRPWGTQGKETHPATETDSWGGREGGVGLCPRNPAPRTQMDSEELRMTWQAYITSRRYPTCYPRVVTLAQAQC